MGNRKHILLFLLLHVCVLGVAQDALMHTQSVMKQEFINPAYNSFKDFTSVNLMSRYQWVSKIDGAPETYAVNVYSPINLSGLGVGFMAINQSIGLRRRLSFSGSFSHNLRVNSSDYLAFGYSVGFQSVAYDVQRLETYPDLDLGTIDFNVTNTTAAFGLVFYDPAYFVGLSSNLLFAGNKSGSGWLVPGFDLTSGFMYNISKGVFFRPDFVLKYYPVKQTIYENGKQYQSLVSPLLDIGINFLLAEKVWLGTSHRFGQAQTCSVDVLIREAFKIGYTYEIGLGKGINQFSSQGIRLTWNLIPKRALKGFDRSGRYNTKGRMCTYLYR